MKYLFIIGNNEDFDTENFRDFVQNIIDMSSSKPFQMFLYKFNAEILESEFPYLSLENDTKKSLSLFPNIILK